MKSRYITTSLLMAGLLAIASPAAMANDELAGALIGAGAGAILGHAIGGHDGAVVGGFLGAAVGASAADDDDYYRHRPAYRYGHHRPYVVYGPPPVRYYAPPPRWYGPRYGHPNWGHDRDRWRDNHGRHGWHEDRGPRYDDVRDYHDW